MLMSTKFKKPVTKEVMVLVVAIESHTRGKAVGNKKDDGA